MHPIAPHEVHSIKVEHYSQNMGYPNRGIPYFYTDGRLLAVRFGSTKKDDPKGSSFLVPATGIEPVRILLRGILSPLCLPIPPCRRATYVTTNFTFRQEENPQGQT